MCLKYANCSFNKIIQFNSKRRLSLHPMQAEVGTIFWLGFSLSALLKKIENALLSSQKQLIKQSRVMSSHLHTYTCVNVYLLNDYINCYNAKN